MQAGDVVLHLHSTLKEATSLHGGDQGEVASAGDRNMQEGRRTESPSAAGTECGFSDPAHPFPGHALRGAQWLSTHPFPPGQPGYALSSNHLL